MSQENLAEVASLELADLCRRFPLGYRPRLTWHNYRVTAGMAYYRTGVIGLSRQVLRDAQSVRETVGHEYAHLLAFVRSGDRGRGHGAAWQKAMYDLGLKPRVCHSYEVQRNQSRQSVRYRCRTCGATILRRRRLPRRRHYVHAVCGGELELIHVEREMPTVTTS